MTILYQGAVQKSRQQWVEVDFSDLPSGVFVPLIQLPPGSMLVNGAYYVLVAADAATSEVITIGTAASASAYGTIANSKTAGRTAATLPAALTTTAVNIGVTRTSVGAQTVGHYGFWVEYVIAGASDATQGYASKT